MRFIVFAATLLLATAGCIGIGEDGDDDGATDDNNTTDGLFDPNGSGNESSNMSGNASANASGNVSGNFSDANMTGNATTNGTGEANWTSENRTGSISGLDLVAVNTAEAEETFTVANGTLSLALNLTVDGADVEMTVVPAGCEDSSCEETASTSEGNASIQVESPEAGEWTVTLTAAGPGPASADYDLIIALLAPPEEGRVP